MTPEEALLKAGIDPKKCSVGANGADDFMADVLEAPLRSQVVLREQVLAQLRKIIDPDLKRDIVSLGFIKELEIEFDCGKVAFTLELTTMACPVKDHFQNEAKRLVKELEWVQIVSMNLTARSRAEENLRFSEAMNLKFVNFVIAIASCKGGVGKSTIAVNLAFMLNARGAKVGIVDVDIYGPSLHELVPVEDSVYCSSSNSKATDDDPMMMNLIPLEKDGIKLMSYSYLRKGKDAYAAVRGPIASSLALEMITRTSWGDLDYLIIDTPPGTGDIHLSICQSVQLSAAVVVTTPQRLSLVDVEKGLHFFEKLNIPTVALAENMAHIECPKCEFQMRHGGHDHKSQQEIDRMIEQFGIGLHHRFPFDFRMETRPWILMMNDDEENVMKKSWEEFTTKFVQELSTLMYSQEVPDLNSTPDGYLCLTIGSKSHFVSMRTVRLACRCAFCSSPANSTSSKGTLRVPLDIHATKMANVGNYAVKITWSGEDAHETVVSFKTLKLLASENLNSPSSTNCGGGPSIDW